MIELPENFLLLEDNEDTYKVKIIRARAEAELEFQKYLLPRMLRDLGFASMLANRFARYVKWEGSRPLNADYSGVVPDDLPFAVTNYENLPFGYEKVFEDENEIHLVSPPDMGGRQDTLLIVPAHMWDRFCSDDSWSSFVNFKHSVPVNDGYQEYYRARAEGCVISEENFQLSNEERSRQREEASRKAKEEAAAQRARWEKEWGCDECRKPEK